EDVDVRVVDRAAVCHPEARDGVALDVAAEPADDGRVGGAHVHRVVAVYAVHGDLGDDAVQRKGGCEVGGETEEEAASDVDLVRAAPARNGRGDGGAQNVDRVAAAPPVDSDAGQERPVGKL